MRRTIATVLTAVVLTGTLTGCGNDQDDRVAYYDAQDGRGEIPYCVYPDDLPQTCEGVRDRDDNLIPPDSWFEVDDDDWNQAGLGVMPLFFMGHMKDKHGYYHSKKYRKHVPADRWASYSASSSKSRYATYERNNSSTIKAFLSKPSSSKSSSFKAPKHRSSFRSGRH